MRKIAIYGKGGIGKSTVTSNISAAIASMGYRVMQIGCDPKADSTINLTRGNRVVPVLEYLKEHGDCTNLNKIVREGYKGVICIEAGGPSPGIGCAGRGIITTFELLDELNAFEIYKPDFVFFDVLGDVVCGGFAMPIRSGYAKEVVIVTSGEKMALFAAENIKRAIDSFQQKSYANLKGIILNHRNVENEYEIVKDFAQKMNTKIIGAVPRDSNIQKYEEKNMTVIEGNDQLDISKTIMDIATSIVEEGRS